MEPSPGDPVAMGIVDGLMARLTEASNEQIDKILNQIGDNLIADLQHDHDSARAGQDGTAGDPRLMALKKAGRRKHDPSYFFWVHRTHRSEAI